MNIDDFLKLKQFRSLDEYLASEMERTAGRDLIAQMIDVFKTPEKVRDYYFSNIGALSGERPYDVCKRGEKKVIFITNPHS